MCLNPPGHWVAAEHGKGGKEGGDKSGDIVAPTDQAEQARATGPEVSSPLDDLCIDIWISVMIIYLRTQMTKR